MNHICLSLPQPAQHTPQMGNQVLTSIVAAFLVPDKIWCMNHSIHYSITDHCSVLLMDTKWQGLARFHLSVCPVLCYEILQIDGTWYEAH
jgi:hypothetical protein